MRRRTKREKTIDPNHLGMIKVSRSIVVEMSCRMVRVSGVIGKNL
jgi:hypothetical protein